MIVRKASNVFKWEECGDFFQLRALRNLRPGISIDWDIGVKPCPPGQMKRTLNLTDNFGKTLSRIRKGSVHFLTRNSVEEPQWSMETSPLIEVLQNPHKNNDIDCSAYKHRSVKMKNLFLRMAPNTTMTVIGNIALRKFLRQHLHSLAERNIKIYLSVKPSPHLLEPAVPICYANDLVDKPNRFSHPLGLKCSGCGKFVGTETVHQRHLQKCKKFRTTNDHLKLHSAQMETTSKNRTQCKSQNILDSKQKESISPISSRKDLSPGPESITPAPESVSPALNSTIPDALKDPSELIRNKDISKVVPTSTTESFSVSINEALEKLASAIGDTHPEFFLQFEAIPNTADVHSETLNAESDTMESYDQSEALSKENTPSSVPCNGSPLLTVELEDKEENELIMDKTIEKEEPQLRRSSHAQKRKVESFSRFQTDKTWEAALERDRKANKRLWSPVKVVGPRDIFKAPGLNKVAIFPEMALKAEKEEPPEDEVDSTESDDLFQF